MLTKCAVFTSPRRAWRVWPLLCVAVFFQMPPSVAAEAPGVVVSEAQSAAIVRQIPLSGTVTSARVSRLSPEVEGQVKALLVDVGDRVAKGDPLLQVDRELAELTFQATRALTEQSRAELDDARRRLTDAQRLRKQNTVSENELLLREAEVQIKAAALKRQEAEERRQQAELARYLVKAPFAGVISERTTEAGEWIEPGTELFKLVATDQLRVDFAVPQAVYPQIDEHSRVLLSLDPLAEEMLAGRIHAVVPVNDPNARTFLMRVLFGQPQPHVIPGMSVSGRLEVGSGRQGVVVSRDAILRYPDGRITLWVVQGEDEARRVSERQVKLGHAFDGKVEVREGLAAGETVVVLGNEALKEGQTVRIERMR